MWQWILIIVCAFMGQVASADEEKAPALTLEDPYTWTWAAMDNPVGLRSWARMQMETLKPETHGRLWSLAVAAFFRKAQPEDFTSLQRERLQKALDLAARSEEHTSELQSHHDLVCRLLLEKKKNKKKNIM